MRAPGMKQLSSSAGSVSLSLIIPVLNEADTIQTRLAALAGLKAAGVEMIVVDGGSADATCAQAARFADRVLRAGRGRAAQMNAGALTATGDVLLFLHADTELPHDAVERISAGLCGGAHLWGRFDVRIAGAHPFLPLVGAMMSIRSRITGVATGDQAMFVRRDAFERVGGFPDIALMEDIALSKALKCVSRPLCIAAPVTTSGRRWDANGFWRTMILMWRLRLAYFFGVNPDDLARRYGYMPRER